MRRLLAITVGTIMLLAGMVAAAASPGTAPSGASPQTMVGSSGPGAFAPAGCPSGALCFWNARNFTGGPGKLFGRNANWSAFGHASCPSGTWNNCASSAYNNGVSCDSVMWDGTNYTFGAAGALVLDRGVGLDLASVGFDGVTSSNSWITPSLATNSTCTGPNPFG